MAPLVLFGDLVLVEVQHPVRGDKDQQVKGAVVSRRLRLELAGVAGVAPIGGAGAAIANSTTTAYGSGSPTVYHVVKPCCQSIVLGPQGNPTTLDTTPRFKQAGIS